MSNTDRGRGHIKCHACGKPTRDHPIRPCATLGLERITVDYVDLKPENVRVRKKRAAKRKETL